MRREAGVTAAGVEWIVEARGCDPALLTSQRALQSVFDEIVRDLRLRVVGAPAWHVFPAPGGITGLCLLAESHLTVHTFPEHGSACFNVFCCRPRPEWDFAARLAALLGATDVSVRRIEREYAGAVAEQVT